MGTDVFFPRVAATCIDVAGSVRAHVVEVELVVGAVGSFRVDERGNGGYITYAFVGIENADAVSSSGIHLLGLSAGADKIGGLVIRYAQAMGDLSTERQ